MSLRERLRLAETALLRRLSVHERRDPLRLLMLTATRLADGWALAILIPLAFALNGVAGGLRAVGLGAASAISLALVVHGIKTLVRRRRPAGIDLERPISAPDKHAFPSGHTAQAFAMVVIAWTVAPAVGACTLVMAVLVGLSRMFFGLHYPTDVVVGALLGLSMAWTVLWLAQRTGFAEWLGSLAPG